MFSKKTSHQIIQDQSQVEATLQFGNARTKAMWRSITSFLAGRPNRLLSWDEVKDKITLSGRIYRGLQSVPIEKIVGSVNRFQDFDRAFLPRRDDLRIRWQSMARAFYDGVSLPPVQLYQAGEAYFVLDGHHRISVARERGMVFIEAQVTKVQTNVPITAHLDAGELEIRGEYSRFLERTRLNELRPEQRIEFTIGGAYDRLLEHIAIHRYLIGLREGSAVSESEAACDWYDRIYMPLVQIIRAQEVLVNFPDRTEADLYLWIIDHQHALEQQCDLAVSPEKAAGHYVDRHSRRLVRRIMSAIHEHLSGPDCEILAQ
jgi:hypothetical protein